MHGLIDRSDRERGNVTLIFYLVSLLQVSKINVCYWKEKVPGTYGVKQRFPCFVLTEGRDFKEHIYGLPSDEYPGLMKVLDPPVSLYREGNPSNVQ